MNRRLYVLAILALALIPLSTGRAGASPANKGSLLAINMMSTAQPFAPLGSGWSYQGRLLDGGSPANGQYDLRFTLFNAPAGGSQVGTPLTLPGQTITNGLFTVTLDFGSAAFQGDARFMQIEVQHNGGGFILLSPRQPLTPAPYAMSLMPGAVISGTSGLSTLQVINSGGSGGAALSGTDPLGTGVQGTSTSGNGVKGSNNSPTLAAVGGLNLSSGPAITGLSLSGDGVQGTSSGAGAGVKGRSTGGAGVDGQGNTTGVIGVGTDVNAAGVWGIANSGASAAGLYGTSTTGYGAWGSSTANNGAGVYGVSTSATGIGVLGHNNAGIGVLGQSTSGWAVQGSSSSGIGVRGNGATGVEGVSSNGIGVHGSTDNSSQPGVMGDNTDGGSGVKGSGGTGVQGIGSQIGVMGQTTSTGGIGVEAKGNGTNTTALKVENGAFQIVGAGDQNTAAFHIVVDDQGLNANICASDHQYARIDNPYTDGDPDAFIMVSVGNPNFFGSSPHLAGAGYATAGFGSDCPANKWYLHTRSGTFAHQEEYNILVIKR